MSQSEVPQDFHIIAKPIRFEASPVLLGGQVLLVFDSMMEGGDHASCQGKSEISGCRGISFTESYRK